jgi:hypothetical protein
MDGSTVYDAEAPVAQVVGKSKSKSKSKKKKKKTKKEEFQAELERLHVAMARTTDSAEFERLAQAAGELEEEAYCNFGILIDIDFEDQYESVQWSQIDELFVNVLGRHPRVGGSASGIVTYSSTTMAGATAYEGNFDISLLNGQVQYTSGNRSDFLRRICDSDCCAITMRVFGDVAPGDPLPMKYVYGFFRYYDAQGVLSFKNLTVQECQQGFDHPAGPEEFVEYCSLD